MAEVRLIAAIDIKRGLAKNGSIPWNLPSDRKYFRDHVIDGPVIMGWKTFSNNKFRPFGKGKNYVVTHQTEFYQGVEIINNIDTFLKNLKEDVWVVGGGQLFAATLPYATQLFLTQVKADFECDLFFPKFAGQFRMKENSVEQHENGTDYTYQVWVRGNRNES